MPDAAAGGWLPSTAGVKTGLVLIWFLAALLTEQVRPAAPPPASLAGRAWWQRWGRNLGLFALSGLASALFVFPVTFWAAQHPLWQRPDWLSGPPGLALDLVLLDLWIYWWHRANHELPVFWRFHQVHHRDIHLDATSALRFHFGEVMISAIVRTLPIMLLALPLTSVLIFDILLLIATIFHHANWRLPAGFEHALSRVVITPSRHWVHHHARRADTDSTYGTIFSFWDPLFGTTTATQRSPGMPIGVEGRDEEKFLELLVLPAGPPR